MVLIWLFLLGVARIVSGTFTPTEIVLIVLIGLCSCAGLAAVARSQTAPSWRPGLPAFVVLAALQMGALWLSLQEPLAHR